MGWGLVGALGVVLVAQGYLLYLMGRQVIAQLAVLTIAVHEVRDKLAALDAELHAVDAALQPPERPGGS